jgi:hypothetical protein
MIPMALGLGEGGEQIYRQAQLSVQTRDWSQRVLGLITDSKAALVALLDQPGMKRGAVASTLDIYARQLTEKGISFYTQHYVCSVNKLEISELCLHGFTVRKRTTG